MPGQLRELLSLCHRQFFHCGVVERFSVGKNDVGEDPGLFGSSHLCEDEEDVKELCEDEKLTSKHDSKPDDIKPDDKMIQIETSQQGRVR